MEVWSGEKGRKVYGARKIWLELNSQGVPVARCTVGRLMRELGIRGASPGRKRPPTTLPGDPADRPSDLLGRCFDAAAPNRRRLIRAVVGDIAHRRPGGRHDARRGQQDAGDRGQGRGDAAQPRGCLSRGGARMRFPAGTVCGHDGLLPVRDGPAIAALTGSLAQHGRAGAGAGLPLFAGRAGRGRSAHSQRGRAGRGRGSPAQTSPVARARRVRSARRRQPVLSRIRSRWDRTVRILMYSSAAICASLRPRATRVISSRSRALSLPGPGAAAAAGRGRRASERTPPRWPGSSPRRDLRLLGPGRGRAPAGPGAAALLGGAHPRARHQPPGGA